MSVYVKPQWIIICFSNLDESWII